MSIRALVIEDDATLRGEISHILQLEGFEVVDADNGTRGLELLNSHPPDLILCDIMMPDTDGMAVLKVTKNSEVTRLIPFIFITGISEKSKIRLGMEMGADDYLMKPFTRNELLNTITARLVHRLDIQRFSLHEMEKFVKFILTYIPHEMRTPLHAIIGFSELIKNEAEINSLSRISEMASYIHESGFKLLNLINRYIRFVELQSLKSDDVKLQVMEQTEEILRQEIQKKCNAYNRESDLNVNLQDAPIIVDKELFVIVLQEILDNAFKFSAQGTHITVESYIENKFYCISIIDSGRGMSQDEINKIAALRQFGREIHEQQGAGLGLALAITITELIGGTLSIQSQPSIGTQIVIRLKMPHPMII